MRDNYPAPPIHSSSIPIVNSCSAVNSEIVGGVGGWRQNIQNRLNIKIHNLKFSYAI